jgi:hypothetical protein
MKLWIVHGGYGMWVVRAADEDEACAVAHAGNSGRDGGAMYGYERAEFEYADEITADGPPEVLDHYFG